MIRKDTVIALSGFLLIGGMVAWTGNRFDDQTFASHHKGKHGKPMKVSKAVAHINPTEGYDVHGKVTFHRTEEGIRLEAEVKGLEPGKHGFHIHEKGDCSAPDATSAGGHFNPFNTAHGSPEDSMHHVGDFGNLTADQNGKATFTYTSDDIAFDGPASILGRAVIVHGGEDDLTSQPSGAAGPRVGCGVIGVAETQTPKRGQSSG